MPLTTNTSPPPPHSMFELRIYVSSNPPTISHYVNSMVALSYITKRSASQGGFDFTRAECWWHDHRQWELLID